MLTKKKNVSNSLNLFIGGGDIPKLKRTTKQFVELFYWLLWEPVSYLIFNVLCALYICILIWLQFNSCWKQFLQRLHFLLYSLVLGWNWYRGVTRSRYNRCFTTPIMSILCFNFQILEYWFINRLYCSSIGKYIYIHVSILTCIKLSNVKKLWILNCKVLPGHELSVCCRVKTKIQGSRFFVL